MRPVLLANFATHVGGGEIGLELLAEWLTRCGHAPVLLVPGAGPVGERFERHQIPPSIADGALAIRRHAADADLVHTMAPTGFLAATLARTAKPVIFHALIDVPHELDPLMEAVADVVICNSRATASRFSGSAKVRVIYNGVPEPRCPNRTLGLAAGRKQVGVIGRPAWWKGQSDLLPTAQTIVNRRQDVDVIFAGRPGGRVSDEIEALVERASGRVRMLDWIPDIRDYLREFDLVIVPSRHEGFGRVAAEALRAGVSVLARRSGGLIEVLDGLSDPWLPDDPAQWADAILDHLDRPRDTPEQLRQFGRRFSMERHVTEIIAIYEELRHADARRPLSGSA